MKYINFFVVMFLIATTILFNNQNMDTSFKAYMDYTAITDTTSIQWSMQQTAVADNNGIRKIGDAYCVALGTFFTEECGTKFKIVLDTDVEFICIVSDIKQDVHTDETNRYTPMIDAHGNEIKNSEGVKMVNVVEFIVDTQRLPQIIKEAGDVSQLGFTGNIVSLEKIEE